MGVSCNRINKYIKIIITRALKKYNGLNTGNNENVVKDFWEYQYQNINEDTLNYFTVYIYDPSYCVLYCDWNDHNNTELNTKLSNWKNHTYWCDKIKSVSRWKMGHVVYLAFSHSSLTNGINIYWSKSGKKTSTYHPEFSLKINSEGYITEI